jgi:DNA-binding response OmpR family regulator
LADRHNGFALRWTCIVTSVLLLDRDPSASAAIRALLELEGFEVVTANGDQAGIEAIESAVYDAVVIDISVPNASGLDIIKRLHDRAPKVPIIAIAPRRFHDSLGSDRDFLETARSLGAAEGLYKPFMPRELINAVASGVDVSPARRG